MPNKLYWKKKFWQFVAILYSSKTPPSWKSNNFWLRRMVILPINSYHYFFIEHQDFMYYFWFFVILFLIFFYKNRVYLGVIKINTCYHSYQGQIIPSLIERKVWWKFFFFFWWYEVSFHWNNRLITNIIYQIQDLFIKSGSAIILTSICWLKDYWYSMMEEWGNVGDFVYT